MKIGLFIGTFAGGGAERMMVNLAKGLVNEGIDITIYVVNKTGPFLKEVPENVLIKSYESNYGVKSILHKIRKTLKNDGLNTFISTQMHINSAVGLASIGLKNRPRIIFREANTPSKIIVSKFEGLIYKWCYSFADHFVAVSKGVADDMVEYFKLNPAKISVIYNPVIDDTIYKKMNEVVDHPWFNDPKLKVLIGMGRILPQKRFEDLIYSFYEVNKIIPSTRLVIFGNRNIDSNYYNKLNIILNKLKIQNYVDFPGFVDNPFKYMKKASLFVLSSDYEGLPGVLIQAMACECQIISTNCPSGPNEILQYGKYGKLVEVGNISELSTEIINNLNGVNNYNNMKKRANDFTVENSVSKYLNIII